MTTYGDARYILREIQAIPYYEERIARTRKRLSEIQRQIDEATSPVSTCGEDVVIDGKVVRVKIPGTGSYDSGKAITNLITRQRPLEVSLREFEKRWRTAIAYRKKVLSASSDGFAADFLSGSKSYKQLESEYAVGNAYDRMLRIIRSAIHIA